MPDCYEKDQVMTTHFDAILIGAGQAGPSLAGRLTAAGMRVAVIERKFFGGTCVNTGCTPTKTLVASAAAAHLARRAGDYGVSIGGAVSIDMRAVKARMDVISHSSRDGVESWLREMERCTVIQGHARFENLFVGSMSQLVRYRLQLSVELWATPGKATISTDHHQHQHEARLWELPSVLPRPLQGHGMRL